MSINYVRPSVQIVDPMNGVHIMKKLEKCARTCYQSENKEHKTTTEQFLKSIIKSGHTSVLEHESITIDLITSRDVLVELTRHRIGVGYSVESTRYVNYEKSVDFVRPMEYDFEGTGLAVKKEMEARRKIFEEACETAAYAYAQLIKNGAKPQEARCVLPQALKVNMKVTMNIRAWRHFFELRCAPGAHPNIKEIAIALLLYFRKKMLPLFEDIPYDKAFYEKYHNRIDRIIVAPIDSSFRPHQETCRKFCNPKDAVPAGRKLEGKKDIEEIWKKYNDDINLVKEKHNEHIDSISDIIAYMTKKLNEIDEAEQKKEAEKVKKMTAAMDIDDSGHLSVDEALDALGEVFEKWGNHKRPKVECFHLENPEDAARLMKHLFGE